MPADATVWAYETVRQEIVNKLEAQGRPMIILNITNGRASTCKDITAWAASMGYAAQANAANTQICITRQTDPAWRPSFTQKRG